MTDDEPTMRSATNPMYRKEEAVDALGNNIEVGRWYLRGREDRAPSLCYIEKYDEYFGAFSEIIRGSSGPITLEILSKCIPVNPERLIEDIEWLKQCNKNKQVRVKHNNS